MVEENKIKAETKKPFQATIKKAVIFGRKHYKEEWKDNFIDIDPAFDNVDTMHKALNLLGF